MNLDDALLLLMMLGGLALFANAFLPGQHIAWRIFSGIVGPVLFVWMLWVFFFGGVYYVNLFIVLLPFLLAAQGVRSMLRARQQQYDGPYAPQDAPYAPPPSPYGQDAPPLGHQPSAPRPYGQQPGASPYPGYPGQPTPGVPPAGAPPHGASYPPHPATPPAGQPAQQPYLQQQPYPDPRQGPSQGQWPPQQY